MTIMGTIVLALGALLLLAGTFLCVLSHDKFKQLIIRGCLHDAGIACIGLACPSAAARAGFLIYAGFQVLARLLALKSLEDLRPAAPAKLTGNDLWDLRGAGRTAPFTGALFAFGMLAAVGGSAFFIPEGRYLITAGAVSILPQTSLGVYAILLAAACTIVQVWLAVAAVNAVLLTKAPAAPGIEARPSKITIILAGCVAAFGFLRTPILSIFAAICGFEAAHSSVHAAFWMLYLGAFASGIAFFLNLRRIGVIIGVAASALALFTVWAFPASPLSQLFLVLVTVGALIISIYSIGYMANEERQGWYWFFLLLTFASLAGIVSSDSASSLYGNWELMTFASFFLVAHEADYTARSAGLKYYVMCAGGALFMLPGILILSGPGHLAAVDAITAPAAWSGILNLPAGWIQAALILCIAGFGVKAGLVPMHSWLPDAHPAAPSSVSAPLSGIITKMGFFGLAAVCAGQMGQALTATPGYFGLSWYGTGLAALGIATLFYGELMALKQRDIKRMLAYSTLGQIGEITIVLSLGTLLATTASFFHILNHAIMKDLLFLCAGALILRAGTRTLSDFRGAASQMPVTCCCMAVGLISIMGLPPFAAFYSKFAMIQAAVSADHIWIAAAILTGSFIGVIYYTRILNTIIFEKRPEDAPRLQEAPLSMQIAMLLLTAASLIFGLCPNLPYSLAAAAAAACSGIGQALPASALLVPWPSYVLLPIFGAVIPAFFMFNRRLAGWSSVAVLAITCILVIANGHDLDNLSYAFAIIVPALGALNMAYAVGYMEESHTQWRFYCVFTAMCGGLVGMAASKTLFGFFMFWEIMSSWTLYMALAHEGDRVSIREAFKYFLFNVAGASFIFVGVCVIGGSAPMTVFPGTKLAGILPQGSSLCTGLALLAIGFVMKAAQFPIRIDWQMHPAVAPTPVSGYISSMLLKSAIIGLCKLFLILGQGAPALYNVIQSDFIMWIGGITIVLAAWQAMRADHVKLVFIYSTVSQIGYMVLAVAVGAYALAKGGDASLGFSGGLLHLINHVFFKDLLFLVCGAIMFMTAKDHLRDLGGLGRKMPFTMLMFFIAGLSVIGVPPTSGFSSKWIIYHALMKSGQPVLALLSLFGSVLTLAYIAKFMHACFLGQPNPAMENVKDVPMVMRVPMMILAAGCILTGIFPGLMLGPIDSIIAQYNIPPIPFTLGTIGSGATAWSASTMFVLMAVPFAAGCWFIKRFVKLHEVDVHNCGLSPEESTDRIRPASIFGGLPAFFRNLRKDPFETGRED